MTQDEPHSKLTIVSYIPPPLPNNRPVLLGNPALIRSDNLPNGRPILMRERQVTSVDHLPLHRPVFHSDLDIVSMHGDRPVLRLKMNLVASDKLPEHRPIATGSLIQEHNMMEFLDGVCGAIARKPTLSL